MKWFSKKTCKRIGHNWSADWNLDESKNAKELKKRGIDRFLNECINGCGEQRDITQTEDVTQMYGLMAPS